MEKERAEKTVEVFEGMTLLEFSKRTGESFPVLQSILLDVGETVTSEFDAISIDVAELLAMVKVLSLIHFLKNYIYKKKW